MLGRIIRYSIYFRRGHSVYLALLISLANFIVIQYRLVVQYMPGVELVFRELWIFAVSFLVSYMVLATVVGWLDFKKGSVRHDFKHPARFRS
ncbi:MAG: hypothetical protein QW420_06345 [Candidatus Caldarchaeum sp.]